MIGIKYCGGCNPLYDRIVLAEKIMNQHKDHINYELAADCKPYAGVLLICGCPNCCVSHDHLAAEHGKVFIRNEEDFGKACTFLGAIILNNRGGSDELEGILQK